MNHSISLNAHPHDLLDVFQGSPLSDSTEGLVGSNSGTFPLTMAGEGEPVRIHSLRGGKGLVMRLTELGLNQGAEVRIVQRQGGGLLVARGETRIALGGGMAAKILVGRITR
ncbi:FeoA family protein [Thiocystis violacea]|uniref:FeoA family protein n=1 Tax=Thiocystis violacea TaxID=13725 RepID=UPI001902E871|nr:FeoA family protein [Thiocystis violacea]MBK1716265.1 iron transporter FeoA [Thiocystis violacea]